MYKIYKIEDGEDLSMIASKFQTTEKEILELNGLDRNIPLTDGNLLIVPNNNFLFTRYRVKKGDNPSSIARENNVSVDALLAINGLDKDDIIYPDETLLIPNRTVSIYVTKSNDTLGSVASNFKTSKERIVRDNENIYLLPDQVIVYKKENIQ